MLLFTSRFIALALLLVSAYALHIYGTGHILSERISKPDAPIMQHEISPYLSADALTIIGENGLSDEDEEFLAIKALSQDPTHGRSAALLLAVYNRESRGASAASAAELAGKLWPTHIYTHSRLADYWLSQGRTDKFLSELSLLLIREPSLRKHLFPVIEEMTISAGDFDLLHPFIESPPNWWSSFFSVVSRKISLSDLQRLYLKRKQSLVPLEARERASLISRFSKEKQWKEAYEIWLEGLNAEQKALLKDGLYDGGFESKERASGFGWVYGRNDSFTMKPRITYGAGGRRALQILFKQGGKGVRFNHLSQKLLLTPGNYNLSYRARLDTLKTTKGLVWRVRCVSTGGSILAEGELLKGRKSWKTHSLNFNVPSSCEMQSIRLEAASRFIHDHIFTGQLWLDDFVLTKAGSID